MNGRRGTRQKNAGLLVYRPESMPGDEMTFTSRLTGIYPETHNFGRSTRPKPLQMKGLEFGLSVAPRQAS